jgi:hypothetical protein
MAVDAIGANENLPLYEHVVCQNFWCEKGFRFRQFLQLIE